ncbi:MAG: polysaccharide deacetylase [Deltaproteobacteria bacterium]|nr:polysaccharide deacetylase [Deltaproteobacteria bacterium]
MVAPWPPGIRCVCLFTFDFDAESSWLQRGFTDPVALSIGQFGPKVGVPSLLNLLDHFGIKTTFFVPGWVAEHYADRVQEIARRGHEVGHHGYLHEPGGSFASPQEEEETILKGIECLVKVVGRQPTGYRAPAWEFSQHTVALLEKHGFDYTSDLMDSLVPTYHTIGGRPSRMMNLPVHWVLDDLSHFFYHITARKPILSCEQVLQLYKEEFRGIYAYGGLFTLTMHPQASGRPSRVLMLKEFIEYVQTFPGVWITSPAEVVAHWRSAHPNG